MICLHPGAAHRDCLWAESQEGIVKVSSKDSGRSGAPDGLLRASVHARKRMVRVWAWVSMKEGRLPKGPCKISVC